MISFYKEKQALKRPANAKSSACKRCFTIIFYLMKKINFRNLSLLMGGAVVAQDWCTAIQNEANTNGHKWTPAFWDEWATVYEQGGCLHGVVTP